MRFSNYKKAKYIPATYLTLFTTLGVFGYLEYKYHQQSAIMGEIVFWVFISILILLLIYTYKYGRYFEYDSDGEALCFRSTGNVVSNRMSYREQKVEFPKYKLNDFKIINKVFARKLILYVRSNRSKRKKKKVVFDITFVSEKHVKAMKISLHKVKKENRLANERREQERTAS